MASSFSFLGSTAGISAGKSAGTTAMEENCRGMGRHERVQGRVPRIDVALPESGIMG